MPWRRLFRTSLCALGAVATACTPFKVDPPGDSGDIEANAASPDDSGKLGGPANAAEGGKDAGAWPPCDLSKPFGPPTFVPGLANTGAITVGGLRLSPDCLTAYFGATYPASGRGSELYTATRSGPGAPFDNIAPLGDGTVNTLYDEAAPAVSNDGLTLFFVRLYRAALRLHYATRKSMLVPFTYAGPISPNNASALDNAPFLREDGKVLYFDS